MNNTIKTCVENLRSSLDSMAIDKFVVDTLEVLMQIERQEYLENAKKDKGNGFYSRTYKTLTRNSMLIDIPRTRTGNFKPELLQLIKINEEQINHFCLNLYRKGMTTRDVEDLMKSFFGESVSHSKVSYLAEQFHEIRMAWENTKLEKKYLAVYCDCIQIVVRRGDRYESEAVYVCYGVREDHKRELLALEINPTESSWYWGQIFKKLKRRGVEEIGLIVTDGLKGIRDTILRNFRGTKHQSCVVHKMRNVLKRVSKKERSIVAEDLKDVFDNFDKESTQEKAKKKLEGFIKKWERKYDFKKHFSEECVNSLFSYIEFDAKVRRMIYTTNSIENLNKTIRKGTKNKLSFESPERLLDYVFMIIKDFEEKNWMKYPVNNFKFFKKRHT